MIDLDLDRLEIPRIAGDAAANWLAWLAYPALDRSQKRKRAGFFEAMRASIEGRRKKRHTETIQTCLLIGSRAVGIYIDMTDARERASDAASNATLKAACLAVLANAGTLKRDPMPLSASRISPEKDIGKRVWRKPMPALALALGVFRIYWREWHLRRIASPYAVTGDPLDDLLSGRWVPDAMQVAQQEALNIFPLYRPGRLIIPARDCQDLTPLLRAIEKRCAEPR